VSGGGPVVVAILREQLTAVDRQRGATGGTSSYLVGVRGGALEAVDIDIDIGVEEQKLVANLDRIGAEDPPRHVDGQVQVC
jgi:hypothetical protein